MKQTPKRVLVIDDELDHCEIIEECLSLPGHERFDVTFAHTVRDACRILAQQDFSFVLLDHNLPDGHGCDILEQVDEHLLTTPVIGLSTSADPQVALADFRGGAIEFITKHDAFNGTNLRQRVLQVLANHARRLAAHDLERRQQFAAITQLSETLVVASRTDSLMQISNRAAFIDWHADLHRRAKTSGQAYALCVVDVDNFKSYNDRYGHAAGDEVLKQVAKAIKACVRPGDLVARYGGEEIVVLLEGSRQIGAVQTARRVRDSIVSLELPHETNGEHGIVTVSVGVARFDPRSRETGADVFKRADQAMYAAKAAGRNSVVAADDEPQPTDIGVDDAA